MLLCKLFEDQGYYPDSPVEEYNRWSSATDYLIEDVKFFANAGGELVSIVVLYEDGK